MRAHDWTVRLDHEVEAAKGRPFRWGGGDEGHDCIQFAARCVVAITGADYRGAFPSYASKEGALEIIEQHGSLEALIEHVLGEPIPSARAQRGDVVLIDTEIGEAAGICLGRVCAFAAPSGLTFVPLAAVKAAWRI